MWDVRFKTWREHLFLFIYSINSLVPLSCFDKGLKSLFGLRWGKGTDLTGRLIICYVGDCLLPQEAVLLCRSGEAENKRSKSGFTTNKPLSLKWSWLGSGSTFQWRKMFLCFYVILSYYPIWSLCWQIRDVFSLLQDHKGINFLTCRLCTSTSRLAWASHAQFLKEGGRKVAYIQNGTLEE